MNSFYKYILFFILGIIIYYFFKENLIEGNIFDNISTDPDTINSLERGCSNYTCDSDHTTYNNYRRKIYPASDPNKPEIYDNCSNLSNDEYITSNPNFLSCSHEICCENRICKTEESNITCEADQVFIPNKNCGYEITNAETCTSDICCQSITDNTTANSNHGGLFEDIINFRNNKGGNINNGNNITGEDIRNYLYYSLLNLVEIDELNNPISDIRFNEDEVRASFRDNWNYIAIYNLKNEDGVVFPLTRNYSHADGDWHVPVSARQFKSSGDTITLTNCYNSFFNRFQGVQYYNYNYDLSSYPQIGNRVIDDIMITKYNNDSNCEHYWLNDGQVTGGRLLPTINYKYLDVDGLGTLNYNDYELLSEWISGLDITNTDAAVAAQEVNKLILIPDLERDGNLRSSLNYIINIIDNTNSEITKSDIKKMIINLTKEIDIQGTNIKTTYLDRFFHTYINNYENSLIDKNIFLGLLNQ